MEIDSVKQLYDSLLADRARYEDLWKRISYYTGIGVDPNYVWNGGDGKENSARDEFMDDPTSYIAVNQFGDYLLGIIWGTGANVYDLIPSRYVLETATADEVADWYSFVSDQTLYHMNHPLAGLNTALRPYIYDQAAFGTSGVGAFPNMGFVERVDDNALLFSNYGIDNLAIGAGKNGQIDTVFSAHKWKVNRIVKEFAFQGGAFNQEMFAKLPNAIQQAWGSGDYNKVFDLVHGVFLNEDYNPKLRGKRGSKYRGVWFDKQTNDIFYEEYYRDKPIAVCRQILVRGETYGRSAGTMLLSTISAVNYMMSQTIEVIEKMNRPSLGIYSNAIFGDSVLDTSPDGLTSFNQAVSNGQAPVFPLYDVGDPSAIVQFLLPYLNEKITTAFKIDALLDFNAGGGMTATESLQRYTIRGKSLSGILQQQKIELLEPLIRRCVSILQDMEELGAEPKSDAAAMLLRNNLNARVIPDSVLKVMREGRPWYEIRFNNEMERLTRTEKIQATLQVLQAVGAVAQYEPNIVASIDWYKMLEEIKAESDHGGDYMLSEDEYKAALDGLAEMAKMQQQMQMAGQTAAIEKTASEAQRNIAQTR